MLETYEFPCGCRWPVLGPPPAPGLPPLIDIDQDALPECPLTYKLLASGRTKGVFQLEKRLGQDWAKRLAPESIEHLAALGALLRPGALNAKDDRGVSMTEVFCRRKNGEEPADAYLPALDKILSPTYQVIAYQEQVLRIADELAGMDANERDKLRAALGKKDQLEMTRCRDVYRAGIVSTGVVTVEQGDAVWAWIQESGRYLFNKCVSECTFIRRAGTGRNLRSGGMTVGEMWKIRNDSSYAKATNHHDLHRKWKRLGHYGKGLSLCEDGRVRPNIIRDIKPAGKRVVYEITLENGSSVRTTGNHKFPTSGGEMTVDQIVASGGVSLLLCGPYDKTPPRKYGFSNMTAADRQVVKSVLGKFGSEKVAYTNGSFTEFRANQKAIPKVCVGCGKEGGRLEIHHKDGDRTNSKAENLAWHCSSCHKKAEYAQGRVKRGEKGYPTLSSPILSIVAVGESETYDVTMDGPNHTFVVRGDIITCNSHSVSYGLTGYETAYLKAHAPHAFFANWLVFAKDGAKPKEEVKLLVSDARHFDILILPPDFRTRQPLVHLDGQGVRFGLTDIRDVGDATLKRINDYLSVGEEALGKAVRDWSWVDFLLWGSTEFPAGSKAMVKAGAMDWSKLTRKRMMAELAAVGILTAGEVKKARGAGPFKSCEEIIDWVADNAKILTPKTKDTAVAKAHARTEKLKGEVYALKNPFASEVDTPADNAMGEEYTLGAAITCSRLDGFDLSDASHSCREFGNDAPGDNRGRYKLAVALEEVRTMKTKSGKTPGATMAYLAIGDESSTIEGVQVFPEAWSEFGQHIREGAAVLLVGRRDARRGNLVVDTVRPLNPLV